MDMMIPSIITFRIFLRRRWIRPARGFTLIELMITVAVVAILGSIAYPSYQDFVQRSRRQEAKAALADAAARQEKFYLNNKTYTTNQGAGGLNLPLRTADLNHDGDTADAGETDTFTENGGYRITPPAPCATGTIATCYTLSATPTPGGPQAGDTKCATLTLNSSGVKSATGTMPNECW